MMNSTQAQINASEKTVEKKSEFPLTAKEKAEFIDNFESMSAIFALVGLLGPTRVPRYLLEKAYGAGTQALVNAKVLIMHYSEHDKEVMDIINAENEKRKAEEATKKATETEGA